MSGRNSKTLVIIVMVVCTLACNIQGRRIYQAYVALDGKGPVTDPPWDAPDTVVLYRQGRNSVVCFDGFHSKTLHERLSAKNGQQVTVEYDTFSDFGKIRGYNVHSVDGFVLANGDRVLRNDFAGAGGVVASRRENGSYSGGSSDCW